jgi:hypothetical protein
MARVTCNVRMGSAHCRPCDAWVGGRWHRRQSRAMARVATCARASATREPIVARPFVTKTCGMQSKVEVKKDRASNLSSLAASHRSRYARRRPARTRRKKRKRAHPIRGAAVASHTMREKPHPVRHRRPSTSRSEYAPARTIVEPASSRKDAAGAREITGDSDHAGNSRLRAQRRDCATRRASRRYDKAIVPQHASARLALILEWPRRLPIGRVIDAPQLQRYDSSLNWISTTTVL